MKLSQNIQNIVLIDHLTIDFREALCTLTGETGAGKSILLDSLGLALGTRAEARLVRKGQEQASVIATFDLKRDHPVFGFLKDQDIILDDEILILRRTLKADGGSKAFLNDQPISVTMLSQIGSMLVEIHGQHETQGLLDPTTYRVHLDQFARISKDLAELKNLWFTWQAAQKEFEEKEIASETARAEEEYLRQAIEDLDKLNPQENEEKELTDLRTRLMNREHILEGLNTAYYALNSEQDPVNMAARALDRIIDKAGESLNDAVSALDRANAEIQEAISLIQSASNEFNETDYNLQEIDDRLFALKAQARKHGCNISDLPEKRNDLAVSLNLIEASDDLLSDLLKKTNAARKAYISKAEELSKQRNSAAQKLDHDVAKELPPLKMERAQFVTKVDQLPDLSHWAYVGAPLAIP